jgi:hypothetical protein
VATARLEAAQVTLPALTDIDGDPGVLLGEGTFEAVIVHNGVVEVHRHGQPIPLGDASHSRAHAIALGAALLAAGAATAHRPGAGTADPSQ